MMNIDEEKLNAYCFRVIRRKAKDILNPISNEELGSYVRGVMDLQSMIYQDIQSSDTVGKIYGITTDDENPEKSGFDDSKIEKAYEKYKELKEKSNNSKIEKPYDGYKELLDKGKI